MVDALMLISCFVFFLLYSSVNQRNPLESSSEHSPVFVVCVLQMGSIEVFAVKPSMVDRGLSV